MDALIDTQYEENIQKIRDLYAAASYVHDDYQDIISLRELFLNEEPNSREKIANKKNNALNVIYTDSNIIFSKDELAGAAFAEDYVLISGIQGTVRLYFEQTGPALKKHRIYIDVSGGVLQWAVGDKTAMDLIELVVLDSTEDADVTYNGFAIHKEPIQSDVDLAPDVREAIDKWKEM